MTQNDYHDGQTFGLMSFVAFWTVKVESQKVMRKAVYEMVFGDPSHNTGRAIQAFDYGLGELQKDMSSENVTLENLSILIVHLVIRKIVLCSRICQKF